MSALTREEIRQRIMQIASERSGAPLLPGQMAMALGWWAHVNATIEWMDELVEDGLLRRLTPIELRMYGLVTGYWYAQSIPWAAQGADDYIRTLRTKRPRILCDVDGILADFTGRALQRLNAALGMNVCSDDVTAWDLTLQYPEEHRGLLSTFCCEPGFCRGLEFYPGSQEAMKELRRLGDVYMVTSPFPNSPTWMHEREQWLKEHFDTPASKVIHTSAKYVCEGDVFLDDRPTNVAAWLEAHPKGLGLLWNHPYNRQDDVGRRVYSWLHVMNAIVERSP